MKPPLTLTDAECVTVHAALNIAIERYIKNAAFCVDVGQTYGAAQFERQADEVRRLLTQFESQRRVEQSA